MHNKNIDNRWGYVMKQVSADLGGKVDIKPRRMSFPFETVKQRFFFKNNSVISAFAAALSSTFPPGESEFIASVRLYRDRVTDEKLKQQIRGFIGQEGHHSHQHKRANEALKELGLDAVRLEKHLEKDIKKFHIQKVCHPQIPFSHDGRNGTYYGHHGGIYIK